MLPLPQTPPKRQARLDVLPRLLAIYPVLHIEPEVSRQLVHKLRARGNDVAVPSRFRLGGNLFSFGSCGYCGCGEIEWSFDCQI